MSLASREAGACKRRQNPIPDSCSRGKIGWSVTMTMKSQHIDAKRQPKARPQACWINPYSAIVAHTAVAAELLSATRPLLYVAWSISRRLMLRCRPIKYVATLAWKGKVSIAEAATACTPINEATSVTSNDGGREIADAISASRTLPMATSVG